MDRPDNPAPPGASPIKAFLIILALIILTTVIFLMSANGEGSPNAIPTESNPPPDFSLTDEEAIARFEDLNELATRAFVERDETLVPLVATADSPLRQQAVADIRQLERDGVFYRPRLVSMNVEVLENLAAEIVIRQVVRETPRFFDEKGDPVPGGRKTLLETIDWTLRDESGTWKIYNSNVVSSRVVRRNK